jgi:hypothetical protein
MSNAEAFLFLSLMLNLMLGVTLHLVLALYLHARQFRDQWRDQATDTLDAWRRETTVPIVADPKPGSKWGRGS